MNSEVKSLTTNPLQQIDGHQPSDLSHLIRSEESLVGQPTVTKQHGQKPRAVAGLLPGTW